MHIEQVESKNEYSVYSFLFTYNLPYQMRFLGIQPVLQRFLTIPGHSAQWILVLKNPTSEL